MSYRKASTNSPLRKDINAMQVPTQLINNRYSIVRIIGQGGMGAVFEAIDTRLGNQVAVKQTLLAASQPDAAFEREARLLARLRHPALPVVSDYFAEAASKFLVMQFIPGDDLAAMLSQRQSPFPLSDVLRWADMLLDVLEYLHQQQPPVIHRDIKPHNLKLTARGEIVLLDFGLAKGDAGLVRGATTGSSVLAYTPHYAPLEQLQRSGTEPRSDLYALGSTLYQLMTGELPASALDRAAARLQNAPDPLRPAYEVCPHIPVAVDAVLQKALALNINDRYASAQEMRSALSYALPPGRSAAVSNTTAHQFSGAAVASVAGRRGTPTTEATLVVPRQAQPTMVAPPRLFVPGSVPAIAAAPVAGSTRKLWTHWMAANAIWPLLGIAIALALGPASIAAIGLVVGGAQWLVLRRLVDRFPARKWLITNGIAGPLAFLLAFAASSLSGAANSTLAYATGGIVGGAVLGAAQWLILQHYFKRAILWIPTQAFAWGIVVLLCSLSPLFVMVAGVVVGGLSGAVLNRFARVLQTGGPSVQPASVAP